MPPEPPSTHRALRHSATAAAAPEPEVTGAQPEAELQHLVIRDVPAFSDRHLLNVSSQSRLKTLSLWGTYRLTDMGVQRAAPHLGDLEHLVLRHCVIGDSAVGVIGRHMKQLRFLEIGSAGSLTSTGLACLVTLQLCHIKWFVRSLVFVGSPPFSVDWGNRKAREPPAFGNPADELTRAWLRLQV
uniref:Uncharacterized protein n=1 Tax=Bubo bubo TaxID=30461 RepID=A0A8C0EPB7_BUBBB